MIKPNRRGRMPARGAPQILIAFPSARGPLDAKNRMEVVALLGRLLLKAARDRLESEVADDAS